MAAAWSPRKMNSVKNAGIHNRPITISIEGNIAAGKTRLMNQISKRCPWVECLREPIEAWENVKGYSLLQALYNDPGANKALIQSSFLHSLHHLYGAPTRSRIRIIERSLHTSRFIFMDLMRDLGDISPSEHAFLVQQYEDLITGQNSVAAHVDLIIYIRTAPEVAYMRMRTRGRACEQNISLDYLKRVHSKYEEWLGFRRNMANTLVLVVDDHLDAV